MVVLNAEVVDALRMFPSLATVEVVQYVASEAWMELASVSVVPVK